MIIKHSIQDSIVEKLNLQVRQTSTLLVLTVKLWTIHPH